MVAISIPEAQFEDGIRYLEWQSGKSAAGAYLLIHGLGNSADMWIALAPLLAPTHRVIAVDLPGSGKSRDPARFTLDCLAYELVRFMSKIHVDSAAIVGHSLGCLVAARLAAVTPARVRQTTLLSASFFTSSMLFRMSGSVVAHPGAAFATIAQFGGLVTPKPLSELVVGLPIRVRNSLMRPFLAPNADVSSAVLQQAIAHNSPRHLAEIIRLARSTSLLALYQQIPNDFRVLDGKRDLLITPEDRTTMQSLVGATRYQELSDCGHWPLLERPSAIAEYLETHLS